MSSQNIPHATVGSSSALTGVTTSVAVHIALPSNTLLKDPMNALSLGQHTHIHNHNENALAHSPAVSLSLPSGSNCSSAMTTVINDIRSTVGVRKSTSPSASAGRPNSKRSPMTVLSSLHSCSAGSLSDTASSPSAARMNPLYSSTVASTYR